MHYPHPAHNHTAPKKEALYFDAIHDKHHGKYTNDSWSEEGDNCLIKWNPLVRRAEVWSLVDPSIKSWG
jgi:hypothetical protein